MGIRLAGEPVARPIFYGALAAAQNIGASADGVGSYGNNVLYMIHAANQGGSAVNLTVVDDKGQIDSLQVPANDTRDLFYGPGGVRYIGQLVITPTGPIDVTVILL